MAKHSLREKLHYHFENTLSSGPMGVIQWLAIISFVSVLILGAIILIMGIASSSGPDAEPLGFIEGTWKSLMATLDPGTMGADEGWGFRIVRFVATLIGIFVISILIGSIALTKSQRIYENAILKTLGARRLTLATILLAEYGLLGILSGIIGSGFAVLLSFAVSKYLMEIDWEFDWALMIVGILITAVLVMLVGAVASFDVLFRKPLVTLRSQ